MKHYKILVMGLIVPWIEGPVIKEFVVRSD